MGKTANMFQVCVTQCCSAAQRISYLFLLSLHHILVNYIPKSLWIWNTEIFNWGSQTNSSKSHFEGTTNDLSSKEQNIKGLSLWYVCLCSSVCHRPCTIVMTVKVFISLRTCKMSFFVRLRSWFFFLSPLQFHWWTDALSHCEHWHAVC